MAVCRFSEYIQIQNLNIYIINEVVIQTQKSNFFSITE